MANRAYTGRARRGFAQMAQTIIDDDPTVVHRDREAHPDKFREKTTETVGPYTVRIEPYKISRGVVHTDEKGTLGAQPYILLATNVPLGTFKVDDTVRDSYRRFRVTAPANARGVYEALLDGVLTQFAEVTEVNLDLLG